MIVLKKKFKIWREILSAHLDTTSFVPALYKQLKSQSMSAWVILGKQLYPGLYMDFWWGFAIHFSKTQYNYFYSTRTARKLME